MQACSYKQSDVCLNLWTYTKCACVCVGGCTALVCLCYCPKTYQPKEPLCDLLLSCTPNPNTHTKEAINNSLVLKTKKCNRLLQLHLRLQSFSVKLKDEEQESG